MSHLFCAQLLTLESYLLSLYRMYHPVSLCLVSLSSAALATSRSATWSVHVNISRYVSCTKWVIVLFYFLCRELHFWGVPCFCWIQVSCMLLEKAVPFSALCFSLLALDRDRGNTLNRQSGSVFFREQCWRPTVFCFRPQTNSSILLQAK